MLCEYPKPALFTRAAMLTANASASLWPYCVGNVTLDQCGPSVGRLFPLLMQEHVPLLRFPYLGALVPRQTVCYFLRAWLKALNLSSTVGIDPSILHALVHMVYYLLTLY